MAVFKYQAKSMSGQVVKGQIEASDATEARVKIRALRLMPIAVLPAQNPAGPQKSAFASAFGGKVTDKDLQIFTRQFATLINSGIPIVQGLQILGQGSSSPALSAAADSIRQSVEQGKRLGEAMQAFPKIFDKLYINLVKAGEEGGVLDTILNRLAVYIEKSNKIKGKVKGAMFYPAAVLAVSFLVVTGILVYVIPKFEDLFASSGQQLPWLTQMVVDASHWLRDYWYIVVGGVFGLVVGIKKYYETKPGKDMIDSIMIRTPLLGAVIQKSAIARFSRTLSTMLSSGVGVLESLEIAGQVINNAIMEATVFRAKAMVQEGKTMVSAFTKDKYFPDMVVQMIGVGEQTGALDVMLGKVADFYEDEVDYAVGALTSMIEPIMMVFLGAIIAVLVIAMYLPIFNLAGSVS